MNNVAIHHEADLFKLIILVASIVVSMFLATALVALIFMPNQLIMSMYTDDITFLLPLALSTMCSAIVLACYVRSYLSRQKIKQATNYG